MRIRGFALTCGLALWCWCPATFAQDYPGGAGVGTYIHPLQSTSPCLLDQSQEIPESQRDQVHFFVVNGFDPLYFGNLNGMAEYVQSLGFRNTRLFYLYKNSQAADEIRAVRQQNPQAKIILLGYSWGTNAVRSLAHQLNEEGIILDSLIYLGGDTIMNVPRSRPDNCRNVLNITGNGLLFLGYNLYFKGDDIDGADNRRLAVRHMLLPSRRETVEWISQEVIRVAQESPAPVPAMDPAQEGAAGEVRQSSYPSEPPTATPVPATAPMTLSIPKKEGDSWLFP